MKKYFTIPAIFPLLFAFSITGGVVLAQEDGRAQPTREVTEEPTQEPTAEAIQEPTADPTDEATEEPTVEPTEEATEEATVEPTVEPTEDPTAEPTQEPNAEATEEPTAEPTTEPTEEPTVEPTEEATEEATVEPTAEPTEQPTAEPTVERKATGGNIGAMKTFALDPVSVNVYVFNHTNTDDVTVNTTYYKENDSAGVKFLSDTLDSKESVKYVLYPSDQVGLPSDFEQGSAIISAGQPLAVVAEGDSSTPSRCAYEGVISSTTKLVFPAVFRNDNRDRFDISAIQNTGTDPVSVEYQYYDENGNAVFGSPKSRTIQGNASRFINSKNEVSGKFIGSLVVEVVGSGEIVGANFGKNKDETLCYRGFSATDDSSTDELFIAAARRKQGTGSKDSWSQTLVQNVGTSPGTVKVSYFDDTTGAVAATVTTDLDPNQSVKLLTIKNKIGNFVHNLNTQLKNSKWKKGAIKVESLDGRPLVAMELETINTTRIYAYPAVKIEQAGTEFALPLAIRAPAVGVSNTDEKKVKEFSNVQIQNLGSSSANVTLTYYKRNGSQHAQTKTISIAQDGKLNLNTKKINDFSWVNQNNWANKVFDGTVIVSSNQPIAVVVIDWNKNIGKVPGSYYGFKVQ